MAAISLRAPFIVAVLFESPANGYEKIVVSHLSILNKKQNKKQSQSLRDVDCMKVLE
jgi:hypothetical protein